MNGTTAEFAREEREKREGFVSEEDRSCENCGNTSCANSYIAVYWDDCVKSKFTRNWRPKTKPTNEQKQRNFFKSVYQAGLKSKTIKTWGGTPYLEVTLYLPPEALEEIKRWSEEGEEE